MGYRAESETLSPYIHPFKEKKTLVADNIQTNFLC